VGERNTAYSCIDGVLFDKAVTTIICYPAGKGNDYVLPSGVTTIGRYAFSGWAGLTSLTLPDSLTYIGESAFEGCAGLTSLTLPASLTEIEREAFYGCAGLTSIAVSERNTAYSCIDGVLFDKAGTTLIHYPAGKGNVYTLPASLTEIGRWAFSGCAGLTSLTLPDSLTKIGGWAFSGCAGLTSVSIPKHTYVDSRAFEDCPAKVERRG
jgi:hypothetical protein